MLAPSLAYVANLTCSTTTTTTNPSSAWYQPVPCPNAAVTLTPLPPPFHPRPPGHPKHTRSRTRSATTRATATKQRDRRPPGAFVTKALHAPLLLLHPRCSALLLYAALVCFALQLHAAATANCTPLRLPSPPTSLLTHETPPTQIYPPTSLFCCCCRRRRSPPLADVRFPALPCHARCACQIRTERRDRRLIARHARRS